MPKCTVIRRLPLALSVLAVLLGATSVAQADPAAHFYAEGTFEGAQLRYQDGIPIATLAGTPEQIGRQHAALLGQPAKEALDFPKHFLAQFGAEIFWPLVVGAGQTLMQHAPENYQREVAAFVAASKLDAGDVGVANTLLELRRMACSVLIANPEKSATGGPLFGRNFDFDTLGELDKYSLVMVYRPIGRHAFAVVGFPACMGAISGMNDAGLAVATLDVEAAADGSVGFNPAGTPLMLVFRRILEECTTVAEAEKLLAAVQATTWTNLAVCDRDRGVIFEITTKQVARREADGGVLPCTNHFRTPNLVVDTVCDRYAKLATAIDEGRLDLAAMHKHLQAASVDDLTLQTMIFEPRRLMVHLALGEPNTAKKPLVAIDLKPFFAAAVPSEANSAARTPRDAIKSAPVPATVGR